jgi:outer membrane protein TolC
MWRVVRAIMSAAVVMTDGSPNPAAAEKIEAALARAYQSNPQLNAQRAAVRQTDEGVPQALSGYRPSISANASAGKQHIDVQGSIPGLPPGGSSTPINIKEAFNTWSVASMHPKTCSTPRPRTGRGRPKARSSLRARRCA